MSLQSMKTGSTTTMSDELITAQEAARITANLHGGDTVLADAIAEHPDVYTGYLDALREIVDLAGLTPARRTLFSRPPQPTTTAVRLDRAVAAVYDRARTDYRHGRGGADRAAGHAYGAAVALAQVHTRATSSNRDLDTALHLIHDGMRRNAPWTSFTAHLPTGRR
ncbi:hypothetical protein GCM10011374_36340 [Kocuria dechangensis]|uniref:Uncharacterized protein n=1 Tax=Kocuria dechangensis TaxID=1176249 RepID=A0A917H5Z2_9MICC|nr:hypothetical protein [Kocuria dechangensis]GGG68668.1 hypothetical protein GCM10011374_36340 [Kocuria dechangensis]